MNKIGLWIGVSLIALAVDAFACERDIDKGVYLCPGDRVVSPDNHTGKVLGINYYHSKVSINYDQYSNHESFDIDRVYAGFGCVLGICVGDGIVSPDNHTGVVIGVNPYNERIVINYDQYSNHDNFSARDIFVTNQCADYDDVDRKPYPKPPPPRPPVPPASKPKPKPSAKVKAKKEKLDEALDDKKDEIKDKADKVEDTVEAVKQHVLTDAEKATAAAEAAAKAAAEKLQAEMKAKAAAAQAAADAAKATAEEAKAKAKKKKRRLSAKGF